MIGDPFRLPPWPCPALREALREAGPGLTAAEDEIARGPWSACTTAGEDLAEIRAALPSAWCMSDGTRCGRYGRCTLTRHLEDRRPETAPRWTRGGRTA